MSKLALNRDNLLRLCEQARITPTTTGIGARIGVHHSQVSRVLNGNRDPGIRFVAGLIDVFGPNSFADLFQVVPDDAGIRA